MKSLAAPWDVASDGPPAPRAREICRGVARTLQAHGFAPLGEVTLASGRRADVVGLSEAAEIWIVEIKSSPEDFRTDQKWPEYRAFCDRFFFAVSPTFPRQVLPADTGLIVADRYGGDIVCAAPEHRLAGARRRALTLQLARTAALRLNGVLDPEHVVQSLSRA